MKNYIHLFDPTGKSEIKEKAYLDIVGRFPKIENRKTMGIDVVEMWVDDNNPESKYGPQRKIGKVNLIDKTIDYHKEMMSFGINPTKNDRRWNCFIYLDAGFKEMDKPVSISATIEKYYFQKNRKNARGTGRSTGASASGYKYRFKINKLTYGSNENIEIVYWRFGAYLTENILNQYQTLNNIIDAANQSILLNKKPSKNPMFREDDSKEETKKSRIPFIGGIAAIIGSAFFLKSRLK